MICAENALWCCADTHLMRRRLCNTLASSNIIIKFITNPSTITVKGVLANPKLESQSGSHSETGFILIFLGKISVYRDA